MVETATAIGSGDIITDVTGVNQDGLQQFLLSQLLLEVVLNSKYIIRSGRPQHISTGRSNLCYRPPTFIIFSALKDHFLYFLNVISSRNSTVQCTGQVLFRLPSSPATHTRMRARSRQHISSHNRSLLFVLLDHVDTLIKSNLFFNLCSGQRVLHI